MLYERGDISKIGKQQTGQGENQKIAMDWVINIIVAFFKSENVSHVQTRHGCTQLPSRGRTTNKPAVGADTSNHEGSHHLKIVISPKGSFNTP